MKFQQFTLFGEAMTVNDAFRRDLLKELQAKSKYIYANGAIDTIFGQGTMLEGLLECFSEDLGVLLYNDTIVVYGYELTDIYGGVPEEYGFIEIGNNSYPDGEGLDRVSFKEFSNLIEIAAKYYLKQYPDRKAHVASLLPAVKATLNQLNDKHERWNLKNV